jgi:hypothetical protein
LSRVQSKADKGNLSSEAKPLPVESTVNSHEQPIENEKDTPIIHDTISYEGGPKSSSVASSSFKDRTQTSSTKRVSFTTAEPNYIYVKSFSDGAPGFPHPSFKEEKYTSMAAAIIGEEMSQLSIDLEKLNHNRKASSVKSDSSSEAVIQLKCKPMTLEGFHALDSTSDCSSLGSLLTSNKVSFREGTNENTEEKDRDTKDRREGFALENLWDEIEGRRICLN